MNHNLAANPPGHPFRRSLPAHVLAPLPAPEPEVAAAIERRARAEELAEAILLQWDKAESQFEADLILPAGIAPTTSQFAAVLPPAPASSNAPRWGFTRRDVRDFAMAYVACFAAVSAFIS